MHSPELKAFIRSHSALFWSIPEDKKEEISEEVLVEYILNYGDMKGIRRLIDLLGMKQVAEIFFRSINLSERRKNNYHDMTLNYFTLFFQRHAQGGV